MIINYKKIIKSRALRIKILKLFNFLPDKIMLKLQYKIKTGRWLNIARPQRYTEKIQWYKLYYRDPLMKQCTDKYTVRSYIEGKGLSHILNKSYGVFTDPEEIPFDTLPEQFVLKSSLGAGGNSIIFCDNKSLLDIRKTKKTMQQWLDTWSNKSAGREWVYENRKHKIIIEEYIKTKNSNERITDYKFFCFYGKIFCIYIIGNRNANGIGELAIVDEFFNRLPYQSSTQSVMSELIVIPEKFEEMKNIARTLSKDFPHVRVDLYYEKNTVLFGELTFFGASGYQNFIPDAFDYIMGDAFKLPSKKKEKLSV